jgi:urease accessory protein
MATTTAEVATRRPGLDAIPTVDPAALLKLQTFLSPAFPVGGFAYSHGLEQLIADGAIGDADPLGAWIATLLERGSGWNDAVLLAAAFRAAEAGDDADLLAIAGLAEALAGSRERHLETMAQGRAFLEASRAFDCPPAAALRAHSGAAYPVAVAAVAAGHAIPAALTLPAFLNAFAANLVSVAVRLVPIGQSAGLSALASLHPEILAVAERALVSTLDDLGSATVRSEIASMRHETLHTRIFRT